MRAELAPWESKMQGVQANIDVAASERDVLLKKQADAQVGTALADPCFCCLFPVCAHSQAKPC